MKIKPEEIQAIYDVINTAMAEPHRYVKRDAALSKILIDIHNRAYRAGWADAIEFADDAIQETIDDAIQEAIEGYGRDT